MLNGSEESRDCSFADGVRQSIALSQWLQPKIMIGPSITARVFVIYIGFPLKGNDIVRVLI